LAGRSSDQSWVKGGQVTWRGLWTGTFLSFFLAIGAPYANTAMHATHMAWDFNTPGAIFLFLVLIGLLNVLFKWSSTSVPCALLVATTTALIYLVTYIYGPFEMAMPGWWLANFLLICAIINIFATIRNSSLALNRSDLVLVYVMMLIVSALCSMGMSQQLLPIISAFVYYATPENKWQELLGPLIPKQLILVNDGKDNASFYEGIGVEAQIPWQIWLEPLFWWAVFLCALYVTMISAAIILRRQWVERERLAFPLTQVGITMIRGESEGKILNTFLKNRVMWMGASLPLIIGSLKALHSYDPAFPVIPMTWMVPFVGNQNLQLSLFFSIIGFSYLISTHIAAGLWFFQLLSKLQSELLLIIGMRSKQTFVYGIADQPYLAYQGGGALIAMVLLGLWIGREHITGVFKKAFGFTREISDKDEVGSYRFAVFSFLAGILVMVGWLWLMGTKLWVAILFVVVALVIFVGISRVVAEAGLAAVRSPMIAPDLIMQGLGTTLIGKGSVFNLSLAYIWAADIRIFILALMANGLKIIEDMDQQSRKMILIGAYWSVILGAIGSCWMVLQMAYRYGGINLVGWFFNGSPNVVYNTALRNLEPSSVAWEELGFFVFGGAGMLLLTWARQYLFWWPLHPIGFAVAGNHMMNKIWFCVFIAWLIKRIVMRYGGPGFYLRTQHLFLGFIIGEVLCKGLWICIDYVTGHTRNVIFILG
tara:strand:- start:5464 stop:7584 length:2121 start_codon:yes stop_codon:yes gene_type:complete